MRRIAVVSALAVAALVVTPGGASADPPPPYGCEYGPRHDAYQGAWAMCNYGHGSVRVWVDCWNEETFKVTRRYGPWVSVPLTSAQWCTASYPVRGSYGYQTQGL